MFDRLKLTLKSITHSGSHIGHDITIKIISSELGVNFEIYKTVLPDSTTLINKEIFNADAEDLPFYVPLNVVVIERDKIFNDEGSISQLLLLRANEDSASEHNISVKVYERRWFFWKRAATFDVLLEVELLKEVPPRRIPTKDDPKWTGDFTDDTEQMILARAIFGEARQNSLSDNVRIAVGWAIKNRVMHPQPNRFGDTYHKVILKEYQFESFEKTNENFELLTDPFSTKNSIDKEAWYNCYEIAGEVINNQVIDLTNGANHFFDDSIALPDWAKSGEFKIKIGPMNFYELP